MPIFLFLQTCRYNISAKALSKISQIIGNENDSTFFENPNFTAINKLNSFVTEDPANGNLEYEIQDPNFGIEAKTRILAGLTLFEFIHYLDSSIGSINWENSLLNPENQKLDNIRFNLEFGSQQSNYRFLAEPNDYNRNFMFYFYDLLPDFNSYSEILTKFFKNSTAAVNFAENLLWALIQSFNPVLIAPKRRSFRQSNDIVAKEVTKFEPPFDVRETLDANATTKREIHDWGFGFKNEISSTKDSRF